MMTTCNITCWEKPNLTLRTHKIVTAANDPKENQKANGSMHPATVHHVSMNIKSKPWKPVECWGSTFCQGLYF